MASGSFILERIRRLAAEQPDKPVFVEHKGAVQRQITYRQYEEESDRLAARLAADGVRKGSVVASYASNGYELNLLDLAILKTGGVHAIFFPNYGVAELKEALAYCRPELFVAGPGFFLSNALQAVENAAGNPVLRCLGENAKGVESLLAPHTSPAFSAEIHAGDLYSLYFTSGTTGGIKAACVTHGAISATVREMQHVFPLRDGNTAVSMAPLSVSSERCLNYYYQCSGITVHYPGSMEHIVQTIASAKPSMFLTSPLFLEKVKKNILQKSEELPPSFKKRIFTAALRFALRNEQLLPYGKPGSLTHFFFDRTVYKRIRGILGGEIRYIMSGGASSNRETLRFFWNVGIPVYEGYGMTECHIISVNRPGASDITLSHVGKPFGEADVKISDEGEILCRSPYLFTRYWDRDALTRESFTDDGYFRTGDRGRIDTDGHLHITGRIKTLFKTQSGIYINPEAVEGKLLQQDGIEQVIVFGENKPYLSALVYAAPAGNEKQDPVELAIRSYNAGKVEAEQVKTFRRLGQPLSVENGELTASQKLKREQVIHNHQRLISEMYEP